MKLHNKDSCSKKQLVDAKKYKNLSINTKLTLHSNTQLTEDTQYQ
jgi:hypothetical protein